MNVNYTSKNGRLTLQAEGDSKEIFEQLAVFDEVFNHKECPANGNEDIMFRVREVGGNKFYELHDRKDGHSLGFGQTKTGNKLFPRRKDKDGNWLPNSGWTKWEGTKTNG